MLESVKTVNGQARSQRAIDCVNPELLGARSTQSCEDVSKHIPQILRLEWERYLVMPPPQPLPGTPTARVAWWDARRAQFPALASVAAFFVRRPRSACHVERVFSLIDHIQTPDRHNFV